MLSTGQGPPSRPPAPTHPQSSINDASLGTRQGTLHRRIPSTDTTNIVHRHAMFDNLARSATSKSQTSYLDWNVDQVGIWLDDSGLSRYRKQFADNHVTGDILPELTSDTLKQLGIAIIGDRHRILQAVKKLAMGVGIPSSAASITSSISPGSSAATTPTSPLPPPLSPSPSPSTSKPRTVAPSSTQRIPQRLDSAHQVQNLTDSPPPYNSTAPSIRSPPILLNPSPRSDSKLPWWDNPATANNSASNSSGNVMRSPERMTDSAAALATFPRTGSPSSITSREQHGSMYSTLPRASSVTESPQLAGQWAAWVEGTAALPRRTSSVGQPTGPDSVISPTGSNSSATHNSSFRDSATVRKSQSVEQILAAASGQNAILTVPPSPPKGPRASKSVEALLGGSPLLPASTSFSLGRDGKLSNDKAGFESPKEATGLKKFLGFGTGRKLSKSNVMEGVPPSSQPGGLVSAIYEDEVPPVPPVPSILASLSRKTSSPISPTSPRIPTSELDMIPARSDSLSRGETLLSHTDYSDDASSSIGSINDYNASPSSLQRTLSRDKSGRNLNKLRIDPPHPIIISQRSASIRSTNSAQVATAASGKVEQKSPPIRPPNNVAAISSMNEFFGMGGSGGGSTGSAGNAGPISPPSTRPDVSVDGNFWATSSPKSSNGGVQNAISNNNLSSAHDRVIPQSRANSAVKVTSPLSNPSQSFLEKMVNKIQSRNVSLSDGGIDAEYETRKFLCIKVDCKTSAEPAKIVQVVDIADNASRIRERVLDQFNIHSDERPFYHFYAGSVAHALTDAELVSICKSLQSSLRGNIQLRREQLFPDPEVHRAQQRELASRDSQMSRAETQRSYRYGLQDPSVIPAFPPAPRLSLPRQDLESYGQQQYDESYLPPLAPPEADVVFERPPSELIVDKFEDYFPDLPKEFAPEPMALSDEYMSNSNSDSTKQSIGTSSSDERFLPRSYSVQSDMAFRASSIEPLHLEGLGVDGLPRRRTVKDRLAESISQRRLSRTASVVAQTALKRRSTRRQDIVSVDERALSQMPTSSNAGNHTSSTSDDVATWRDRVRSMGQDTWLFQQWENMPIASSITGAAVQLAAGDSADFRKSTQSTRLMSVQSSPNIADLPKKHSMPAVARSTNSFVGSSRPPTLALAAFPQRFSSKLAEIAISGSAPVSPVDAEPMVENWTDSSAIVPSMEYDISPPSAISTESVSPVIPSPRRWQWTKGRLIGKGSFGSVYMGLVLENDKTELIAVKQVALNARRSTRAAPVTSSDNINSSGDGSSMNLIGGLVGDASSTATTNNTNSMLANAPSSRDDALSKSKRRMEDALNREVELLKDLDHENIVRYLGFEMNESTLNLFLEYVSGGSVTSLVSRVGKFEEDMSRWIVNQVLCGLEYLHERYIIHRDIKGANILVTDEGVAKISDFGISKKHDDRMVYRAHSRMSLQGSIFWMAPEVIKSRGGYSAKVDIWSVGCVMLEMMTGSHPWAAYDEIQAMWKLGERNAPPIPEDLSTDAADFLAKCFIMDPEDRPTATDLLDHNFTEQDVRFDFKASVEHAAIVRRLRRRASDDDVSTLGGRTLSYSQLAPMQRLLDDDHRHVTEEAASYIDDTTYRNASRHRTMMTIGDDDDDAVVPSTYVENETMLKLNGKLANEVITIEPVVEEAEEPPTFVAPNKLNDGASSEEEAGHVEVPDTMNTTNSPAKKRKSRRKKKKYTTIDADQPGILTDTPSQPPQSSTSQIPAEPFLPVVIPAWMG
ncbi:hypothetical protein SmJEL517_g05689 [Synchytrium microbalum]|uniref:Protein kinase domain-containing protein n=1 Tax=Synchytrium microbalum TaxID=1806994 RepID=A0A507BYN6_9FUNG|nr:uncharacterized protein SmJEL517_g05689 [Synchytrium microbalum]TPX30846.1 hypothetical protein SmJEL517_g05689 [Synchytrium microbalum]